MDIKIPMLPRVFPDEFPSPLPRYLVDALVDGSMSILDASNAFELPGGNFHRSGFLLTAHTVGYLQTGQHTVAIPGPMQQALADTSLGGVCAEDVKLPHTTMYFALPDSRFQVWGGSRTGWHPCGGVYVSYQAASQDTSTAFERPTTMAFYFWGMPNEKSTGVDDDASFWFTICLEEMELNGWDFETYIQNILGDPERDATDEFTRIMVGPRPGNGDPVRDAHKITRLIINSLLYLNSEDANIEQDAVASTQRREARDIERALSRMKNRNKGKAKRLARRLQEVPTDDIMWIGKEATPVPGRLTHEGSWWPRKDVLRKRIQKIESEMEGHPTVEDVRKTLQEAEGTPEELAAQVGALATHRRWWGKKEKKLEELHASLNATRRWIQPRRSKKEQE